MILETRQIDIEECNKILHKELLGQVKEAPNGQVWHIGLMRSKKIT